MQPLRKTVWGFLKKLKIELPYDPAIPLLSIYPKKTKTLNFKRYMHPIFVVTKVFREDLIINRRMVE